MRKFWDSFCDFDSKQKDGAKAKAAGNPFQAEESGEWTELVEKFSTRRFEMMSSVTREHIESVGKTYRTCGCCGMTGSGLLACGGSRKVMYCNKMCQKAAWKEHKKAIELRSLAVRASEANLAQLPPEIFELIAKKIDRVDLLSLRQTSRECADKVFRTYCSTLFPRIQVSMSHEGKNSLDRAINIAQHPVFGALIREFTIAIDDCMTCFKSETSRRGEDGRVLQKRFIIRQKLAQLFNSLRATGNNFDVQILARQGCKCSGQHHQQHCSDMAPTTRRNLIDILEQMRRSDLPVPNLEIGNSRWTFTTQKLRDYEIQVYGNAFRNLKSLKLFISELVADTHNQDAGSGLLMPVIAAAPDLEVLHVIHALPGCGGCRLRGLNLHRIASAIFAAKFRSLKKLHLESLGIRGRPLASFLKEHETTLEKISIKRGFLRVEELHPDQVQDRTALEVLKEMSGFQGLEVDDVFEDRFQKSKRAA
ncbi:uncharacterized protein MYCFIDRAFT_83693, partial [Pseudocercospora fijiensis CIRAD86]